MGGIATGIMIIIASLAILTTPLAGSSVAAHLAESKHWSFSAWYLLHTDSR